MMVLNRDLILTGRLLLALDEMGHGDAVVIADAHFAASKLVQEELIEAAAGDAAGRCL
jgi:L-fucose mutarotase